MGANIVTCDDFNEETKCRHYDALFGEVETVLMINGILGRNIAVVNDSITSYQRQVIKIRSVSGIKVEVWQIFHTKNLSVTIRTSVTVLFDVKLSGLRLTHRIGIRFMSCPNVAVNIGTCVRERTCLRIIGERGTATQSNNMPHSGVSSNGDVLENESRTNKLVPNFSSTMARNCFA